MSRTYRVEARWDSEAGVWVAESDDIPGLVAEAESLNALMEKVRVLVPELFELNGGLEPGQESVNHAPPFRQNRGSPLFYVSAK